MDKKLAEKIFINNILNYIDLRNLKNPIIDFQGINNKIITEIEDVLPIHYKLHKKTDNKSDVIFKIIDGPLSFNDINKIYSNLNDDGVINIFSENNSIFKLGRKFNKDYYKPNNKNDIKLKDINLFPVFREPVGKFNLIPNAKINISNKILKIFGKYIPCTKLFSPYVLISLKKIKDDQYQNKYISLTSTKSRLEKLLHNQLVSKIMKNIGRPGLDLFLFSLRNKKLEILVNEQTKNIKIKKNKKKLIISMTYLQMGGVERVMLNIIKGLNRDKFDITILTTVRSDNDWKDAFIPFVDRIIHVPELFSKTWPLKYHSRFIELFSEKIKANILFITNSITAYQATKIIKTTNPKIRIYDLLHTHGTKFDNDAYLKLSMPYDKYIDKRIVIDEYLKEYYCNKYPVKPDKVFVIYNGLDNSKVIKLSNKKDDFFDNIDENKKIISYIGRLEMDKSPIRLVDIAIKIKENKLPIVIVIVGDGTLKYDMEKKAYKNGALDKTIYFYGRSNSPEQIINKSKFTILVSDNEGIPMSILESMDISVPSIAPAVGGIPEIISDKIDGFLVDINKKDEEERIQAFYNAIINANNLSSNEYINMKKSSKRKIEGKFRKMSEIYEHLFETDEII